MTLEERLFNVTYKQKRGVRKGPALPGDALVESLLQDLEAKKNELDEILNDPSDVLSVWKIEKIGFIYDYVASLRPKLPDKGDTIQLDTAAVVNRMRSDEGAIQDFIRYLGDYVDCVKGHPKNYSKEYCVEAQEKGPRYVRALQAWRGLHPYIIEKPQISAAPITSRLRNRFLKSDFDVEAYKQKFVQKQLRSETRYSSPPENKSIFHELYQKAGWAVKEWVLPLGASAALGAGLVGIGLGIHHYDVIPEQYLKVPGIVQEALDYCCDQDFFLERVKPVYVNSDQGRRSLSVVRRNYLRHGFFESNFNLNGGFRNFFKDNGDRTITDRRTGLMWRTGSTNMVPYAEAERFIRDLNRMKDKGYSDWRIPTIEELGSLLIPGMNTRTNRHIEPEFKHEAWALWSCNDKDSKRKWRVDYRAGIVGYSNKYERHGAGIAVRDVR